MARLRPGGPKSGGFPIFVRSPCNETFRRINCLQGRSFHAANVSARRRSDLIEPRRTARLRTFQPPLRGERLSSRTENQMKRIFTIAALALSALLLMASAASADGTPVFDPAAAPTGTHVQTGTPSCSFVPGTQDITCDPYELAGVGNNDASV